MYLKSCCNLLIPALLIVHLAAAQKTVFPIVTKSVKVTIVYDNNQEKLDSIAAHLLAEDIERVSSFKPGVVTDISKAKGYVIVIGLVTSPLVRKFVNEESAFSRTLIGKWECFGLRIAEKPLAGISKALVIAGSDARGTAYGVFTLSEKIGVSPWYWWADVPVKHKQQVIVDQPEFISSPPGVKYRGIFINDEDWGLQPWAAKTFEKETGDIGPKTYAKVFELLLRLKANLIWPAMHPSTKAFFHYPGNIDAAKDYQVVIGSSHAEPMLRNNVGEWDEKTMGDFNYITNKKKVYDYWESRVKQTADINAIFTTGMRGVHDSQMEGVKDAKEAVPLLEQIIKDQRELLARYVNKDVTIIPQVFTAYKEVLEIYDNGLQLPEDITLVWPDDNYGYIQRLNNEKEQSRKGGAGIYYHASYWGRPHDYLWLPSTHPSLMREEMMKAYETGAKNLWVVNVGDIKPQEYNIQEFLDMAYNPGTFKNSRYSKQHLLAWLAKIFGREKAQRIQSILWEYYQLAFERKPEFMGWSQTEPNTKTNYTEFNHFYFGDEAQKRIDRYEAIEQQVKQLRSRIDSKEENAFYELVYYPVVSASWINKKFLYRDKAYLYSIQNRLSSIDYAQLSKNAYDSIVVETAYYNSELANGKWKNIMSMKPRNLPVYQEPELLSISIDSTSSWGLAPEGFVNKDSSLTGNTHSFSLPLFDIFNKQKYFIDIFLSREPSLNWKASVSNDWIRLSKNSGILAKDFPNNQSRIWVNVDWNKVHGTGKLNGYVDFIADGKQLRVSIEVSSLENPGLSGYKGFIENNGYVAIKAAHFTKQFNTSSSQWKIVNDLGYSGSVLQSFPLKNKMHFVTDTGSIRKYNAVVSYDFYSFSSAIPYVTVFSLPTHPINNNYSLRYAISIDGGPINTVDIKTFGRSEEWKQNVLRNRAERRIELPFLNAGKHSLKIYAIDPGVILDEIRMDLGGLKKAYSQIPETKINSR